MTDQTARAEDEAARRRGSRAPNEPAVHGAGGGCRCACMRAQGPAPAHACRDGESAQAHRARGRRCAALRRRVLCPRHARVADNMRRALDAVTPELRASAESRRQGARRRRRADRARILKALEKNGVRQFTPQGEKFDPNLHQAMFEVPDASVPAGSVVQVVQPGYMIGERVLRPALVGVSKGGPKAPPASRSHGRRLVQSRHFGGSWSCPVAGLHLLTWDRCCRASRASAKTRRATGVGAGEMPSICTCDPEPKRSHCTTMTSAPVPASLALATV
jgi:hypothetical protein